VEQNTSQLQLTPNELTDS